MNILYIPPVGAVKEHDDFYLSLKKLHNVTWFWEYTHEPINDQWDLIHLQSGAIKYMVLKMYKQLNKKAIITQWTGDYRPEGLPEVRMYDGLVDFTFLASDTPEQYPNQNVKWLPHWVGEWQFRPVNAEAEGIVMIANNYTHFPGGLERHEMNEMLRNRPDYKVYGSGFTNSLGPVNYRDTPDIYNKFRFAVGCNIYNDVPKYFSNRPLAAMAAGTCFIFRGVPNIDPFCFTCYDNHGLLDIINGRVYGSELLISETTKYAQRYVMENFHSDVIVKKYLDMIWKG
jgi:hypothetical protein